MKNKDVRKVVRKEYAKVATGNNCCESVSPCGCSGLPEVVSKGIGYSDEDLAGLPEGANMGLGCGNPIALASLKEGETVLDLGSGGGIDCFLAAKKVGESGKVIGVDMTPEMVEKARQNAKKAKHANVEFRLGEIENIPVADNTVDIVISNCVINLSPDKERVFHEANRVLKQNGRMMVSDIVLLIDLPDFIKESVRAYAGCIAGAMKKKDYLDVIKSAGFKNVKVVEESQFPVDYIISDPTIKGIIKELNIHNSDIDKIAKGIVSIKVSATK
jgi:arsenite methyltransferase